MDVIILWRGRGQQRGLDPRHHHLRKPRETLPWSAVHTRPTPAGMKPRSNVAGVRLCCFLCPSGERQGHDQATSNRTDLTHLLFYYVLVVIRFSQAVHPSRFDSGAVDRGDLRRSAPHVFCSLCSGGARLWWWRYQRLKATSFSDNEPCIRIRGLATSMSNVTSFPSGKYRRSPIEQRWRLEMEGASVWIIPLNRPFDFSELVPLYGLRFCRRLAEAFGSACHLSPADSVRTYFFTTRRFFLTVAALGHLAPIGPCASLVHCLSTGSDAPDESTLQDAVEAVCERIRNLSDNSVVDSSSHRTRMNFIGSLNGVLRRLSKVGMLPRVRGAKYGRVVQAILPRIPTLAELTTTGRSGVQVHQGTSLDQHVAAVLALNVSRLAALRRCLEDDLLSEVAAFRAGQAWIESEDLPTAQSIGAALDDARRQNASVRLSDAVRASLQARFGRDCNFLALAVRWVARRRDGLVLRKMTKKQQQLMFLAGGVRTVGRYLEGNQAATNACFGILLVDTALNVSVLERLSANPFVGEATRGQVKIGILSETKSRARGKTVSAAVTDRTQELHAPLPLKDGSTRVSSLEAIEMYREITAPLRRAAELQGSEDVLGNFWLFRTGSVPAAGTVHSRFASAASTWWPNFLSRHRDNEVIGGLPITRQMIRPTVLQIRHAQGSFHHSIVQTLADHSSAGTSMSYISADWIRAQLAAQIRSFQELFEAALVENLPSAAKKLKISERELRDRVELGFEAGIDFVCVRGQPAVTRASPTPGPTCDPLNPCEECPTRRFVPNEENFLTLHLAHRALAEAEATFMSTNSRRWVSFWLPWRAMTEAYVQKIRESPHKRRYEKVAACTDELVQAGHLVLPLVA